MNPRLKTISPETIASFVVSADECRPTTTTFQAKGFVGAEARHQKGRLIQWLSGNLEEQVVGVMDCVSVGDVFHIETTPMTEAPANDDTGIIV